MPGKAVNEIVLAAVGFIRDDYHVASLGQGWIHPTIFFGQKFLNGGEDNPARSH